ncbi:MAG TPA: biotin/lipoyl-containing protein [Terriglobales bacterium]|jgi:biotin carboxyl carrier protein|nr:biotin/lipoyl-containing protein [Terriglobales bacterium]
MTYDVIIDGRTHRVELERGRDGMQVKVDGKAMTVDAVIAERDVMSLLIEGRSYDIKRETTAASEHMVVRGITFTSEVRDPRALGSRRAAAAASDTGPKKLVSPMPGKVVRILAPAGTAVEAGQGVVVVEAMKMQNEIKSPKAGVVQNVAVTEGMAVNAGDVLATVG